MFVTALVKPVRSPIAPAAMLEAPLIIDAAKSEPGIFGRESEGLLPPEGIPVPVLAGMLSPPPPLVCAAGCQPGL